MNADALNGTVLGTCTLEKLIGRGGTGAVFLAQQSRPRRQVAVKVLLPITALQPSQRAAFLERFRRETDAAASLEHPNILLVHEYGERDGLAYLVMPYVSGGTLRDELDHKGQLPFPTIVNYLEQIAAALDFAHARGVIHRDVKPANILLTPEKRLLLTDFGLVKIISEEQKGQNPLSEIGMPMGTPDYMAPEQVIGSEIDGRADLYALGIILYQMLTGTVPFKGEMPMKVAMHHMHTPPPALRAFRPDLPVAGEQVVLRALAKRSSDRYERAQDLASSFRLVLETAGLLTNVMQNASPAFNAPVASAPNRRRSLLDPVWRTQANGQTPAMTPKEQSPAASPMAHVPFSPMQANEQTPAMTPKEQSPVASSMAHVPFSQLKSRMLRTDIVAQTSMEMPSLSGILTQDTAPTPPLQQAQTAQTPFSPASSAEALPTSFNTTNQSAFSATRLPFGHKTSLRGLSQQGTVTRTLTSSYSEQLPFQVSQMSPLASNDAALDVAMEQPAAFVPPAQNWAGAGATRKLEPTAALTTTGMLPGSTLSPGTTGALSVPTGEYNGETGMLKLAQPVKVVKVPVAGQPGQYLTGILPMLPPEPEPEPLPFRDRVAALPGTVKENKKKTALLSAAVIILLGSMIFLFTHLPVSQTTQTNVSSGVNPAATVGVQATATAQANIIVSDPLAVNTHDWFTSQNAIFKNGAYHITAADPNKIADSLLPDTTLTNFVYTLTMNEVKGNDGSQYNLYGIILRYNTTQQGGHALSSFYSFQILHTKSGALYEFRKYDDTLNNGVVTSNWNTIWHDAVGKEYHSGLGTVDDNTVSVAVKGSKFTFTVNGKHLGTAQDTQLKGGQIGMMVNLQGTEVAFSNLMLTQN